MPGPVVGDHLDRVVARAKGHEHAADHPPSDAIAAPVERDPREPRPHFKGEIEAAQRAVRRDECLLDHVQRIVRIRKAGERHPIERMTVAADDLGERDVPPCDAECRELAVGESGEIETH